ncbi:MAG: NAD-dependent epimerase/dehydratase family protein [Flavisolibacter sp.]|jgi:UDP-glucose 4-epimerase|nr:NAD-dependent epimerase/dehydratase family protein [Flavisolibacter sp.]
MNPLTNRKILVTGGAGFVGSNLVRVLVQQYNAQVTILDDLFTGDLQNLVGVEHTFMLGSVEDKALVNDCVKDMDAVFHLASRNIIISNSNPREDLNVNVGGSFNIFEACQKHGVKRVVYTSTSSVYGDPQKLPVAEEDAKRFLNFYSASKFSAEVYANTFFKVFNLPVTTVRYSNIYGRAQSPLNPYCGVIGKFIDAALLGQPLKVHGDGKQTRDYTYIDDAVSATIAAAIYPQAIGEEYNVGTGRETSVNELAETVIALTGSTSKIETVSNRDIDNISRRCIDISKSESHLQYKPQYSLYKGLENTIAWFSNALHRATPAVLPGIAFLS